MTKEQFASLLKSKNPKWANMDNDALVSSVLERYPSYREKINGMSETQQVEQQPMEQQKSPGFLSRTGTALKDRFGEIKKTFGETARGEISPAETGVRVVGGVAGGVGDVVGAAISPQIEKLAQKEWAKPAFEALASGMDKYEDWKNNSELNRRTAEVLEGFVNIADLAGATGLAKFTTKTVVKAGKEVVETAGKVGVDVVEFVSKKAPELAEKAAKQLASEPIEQVKTILKETPTSKLDEFIDIAKAHSVDQRAISGFEKVGERMSDATKQLQGQLSAIGKQKTSILEKAKTGLAKFTEEPRRAILAVSRLEDSAIKKQILTKLKSIKTKLDADNVIDDIQDIIYTGGRDLTIPQGSALEKQLRGILGKLNGELKDSLPTSYRTLNALYADKIKIVNTLNKALGEVVDGVSTRGSGLVKQFFSPSGTKTKELFEYIKKTTGIDLAQETTLAKFAEELFDNPNVKSLLGGIPRSRTGVIDKTIDFIVDKTGLGGKTRESLRKGTIERAKDITK